MPKDEVSDQVIEELTTGQHRLVGPDFKPRGREETLAQFTDLSAGESDLPTKVDELSEAISRSYDLTASAALDLQIPVGGSGGASANRRVIVLERAAFKRIRLPNKEQQYGYAIRLCITVDRWQATTKVSLPFLAASAQLGNIEAQWVLQIIGLSGQSISSAILPPTDLNVETFVIAKQSLEKIISAIGDPSTVFQPRLIAELQALDSQEKHLREAMGIAFALSCLDQGRSLEEARHRLGSADFSLQDALSKVYEGFAGLKSAIEKPDDQIRQKAGELCGKIRADVPWYR